MNLSEYRKAAGLSQAKLAEVMTAAGFPTTQALVSQWEAGVVRLSAERCAQIEQISSGQVTRAELRPDLFGVLPDVRPADATNAAQPTEQVA